MLLKNVLAAMVLLGALPAYAQQPTTSPSRPLPVVPRREPADSAYHEVEPPELLRNYGMRFRIPASTLRTRTQGEVIERLTIAPDGHVETVQFIRFVPLGKPKNKAITVLTKPEHQDLVQEVERVMREVQFAPSESRTIEIRGFKCSIK